MVDTDSTASMAGKTTLPPKVVNALSTDQFYAYDRRWVIIHGKVDDDDVMYLKVGPIVYSSG